MKIIVIVGAMLTSLLNFNVASSQVKKINTLSKTFVTVNIQSKKTQFEVKSKQQIVNEIQQGEKDLHFLGDYQLVAGIQEINIGHFSLNSDGSYKVTVNSDTDAYGIGRYEYDVKSKALLWRSGLFYLNNYSGILQSAEGKIKEIKFNSVTRAIRK